MKILFVIDPLKKLNSRWDNSLHLAREFNLRGYECFHADASDIILKAKEVTAKCRKLNPRGRTRFTPGPQEHLPVTDFQLVIIRKEPPVDAAYVRMTQLLEKTASRVPTINHPRGIRETNEKLAILNFPKWIPQTLVTNSADTILQFQKRQNNPIVIKPLDQKGGRGVFMIKDSSPRSRARVLRASALGTKTLMAQEFLKRRTGEKRIVLLHGEIFCYYRKQPRGKEFRANLSLGGTFHKCPLTAKEKQLCSVLKPFLLQRGLEFVGIDVLEGRLIEINVTSPAGITEAIVLEPRKRLLEAWADWLEHFSRRSPSRVF